MPGPPKVNPRLKLLRGTGKLNKRRAQTGNVPAQLSKLVLFDAVPPAPRWLTNVEAVREWQRLAPVLTANGLLHAGNVGLLAHACAVHGRLVTIWSTGDDANAALVATYRTICNSLGLTGWTPAPPVAKNRFAANGARNKAGAS